MHILFRILKITGISLGSIILLLFLLPYLFPGSYLQKSGNGPVAAFAPS